MIIQGTRLVALLAAWVFLTTGCSTGAALKLKPREQFEADVAKVLGVALDKISESEARCLKNLGLTGEFKKDSEHAKAVGNCLSGIHVVTRTHDRLITYLFYDESEITGPNWGFKLFLNYRQDGSFGDASCMRLIYPGNNSGSQ